MFNSRYTQYIPLSMYELQTWLGTPCIYVLDCSAAGLIINNFKAMMEQRQQQLVLQQQQAAAAGLLGSGGAVGLPDPMREIIVLGACGGNELLPQVGCLDSLFYVGCCRHSLPFYGRVQVPVELDIFCLVVVLTIHHLEVCRSRERQQAHLEGHFAVCNGAVHTQWCSYSHPTRVVTCSYCVKQCALFTVCLG